MCDEPKSSKSTVQKEVFSQRNGLYVVEPNCTVQVAARSKILNRCRALPHLSHSLTLYREQVDESVLGLFAKAREAAFYLSKAICR